MDSHSQAEKLRAYGWNAFFDSHFASYRETDFRKTPARVALAERGIYRLLAAEGELDGVIAGRLRHHTGGAAELPAVGDWVVLEPPAPGTSMAVIEAVLERRSTLSRQAAGRRTGEQVVAANVDVVFCVMGLDGDYNERRLERFLTMAWASGARPVVVLNKADLTSDARPRRAEIERVHPGAPIVLTSATAGTGVVGLAPFLEPGVTVALVGSSGVGKSTLINCLAGEERMRTGAVRASDERGRHTTTHRELVVLPGGSLLIDNPGIRELQLWSPESGFGRTFGGLETLAAKCRFGDCAHEGEPGCAVSAALESGELSAQRLASWRKLGREARFQDLRQDDRARRAAKKKTAALHRAMKEHKKTRR